MASNAVYIDSLGLYLTPLDGLFGASQLCEAGGSPQADRARARALLKWCRDGETRRSLAMLQPDLLLAPSLS